MATRGYRNRIGAILTWFIAFSRVARRERAFTIAQVGVLPNVYSQPEQAPVPGPAGR